MFQSMSTNGTDGTAAAAGAQPLPQQHLPDEGYSSSARPRWKKPKRGVSDLLCVGVCRVLCACRFFFPFSRRFLELLRLVKPGLASKGMCMPLSSLFVAVPYLPCTCFPAKCS